MDDYPAYSLDHNIPLLITIGLPPPPPLPAADGSAQEDDSRCTLDAELKEQATLLRSEFPVLEGEHATAFSEYISGGGAAVAPWRGRVSAQRYRFRVRTAGRTYHLPPRRARLPSNFEAGDAPVVLHSPFSPLSPSCRLYPDGILDASWLQKHQELVPSVFVVFYALAADATTATLQDGRIKADINGLRTAVQRSGYRSRVAVAVFTEEATASSGSLESQQERLENIRRGSGVDSKLFFVMAADAAADERARVAENLLTTLYGAALDHYRELGRHARKKRGRGSAPQPSVPPTSGTSQTLSLAGWHIRYDVKAAVLAEFRQEADAAARLLDVAYEALLGPDGLDAMPSWSPRWNEARLLADVLAVRRLRCHLLAGQTSGAVRCWEAHRERVRGLVDTRGRGTHNYGWQAWLARWALVMADLVRRVGVPGLAGVAGVVCLPPERSLMAERLAPWHWLHHNGYWLRLAAHHLRRRRALARAIPDDDRRPPDASPASNVAGRAFAYDDYMCPPPNEEFPLVGHGPGVDHTAMIVACLDAARAEFLRRHQTRLAAEVALECGREHAEARNWLAALRLLAPLWADALYRSESWTAANEELAWTLRAAASAVSAADAPERADLLVSIDWELLDSRYTRQPQWQYDVSMALDGLEEDKATKATKTAVKLAGLPPSFLATSFVFKSGEGKAGQVMPAQLTIRSNAQPGSPPIVLDGVHVRFDGSIKPLLLKHAADAGRQAAAAAAGTGVVYRVVVPLEEDEEDDDDGEDEVVRLHGTADLVLYPQATAIYEMAIHLREPGDARAVAADLLYSCARYTLQQTVPLTQAGTTRHDLQWFLSPAARLAVPRADSHAVHILPRPPKMDMQLLQDHGGVDSDHDQDQVVQCYTSEPVDLRFSLHNAEDADASVKLDVVMYGDDVPGFTLSVSGAADTIDDATAPAHREEAVLPAVPLGVVATAQTLQARLRVPPVALSTSFDVTLRAVYHLVHDPATPITQTLSFKLNLSNPFEANYDLLPRLHPAPWPSLFDHEGILAGEDGDDDSSTTNTTPPRGLAQAWTLVTRYASFAAEDLEVVDLALEVQPVPGIVCRVERRRTDPVESKREGTLRIHPQTMEEAQFDLVVQKASLEQRDAASLDVAFVIRWRRGGGGDDTDTDAAVNATTLPVPRLSLFGTEPRVLASVAYAPGGGLLLLDVAIENASNHFLTFGLSMEPSADFAFSGPKLTTVHVLPVSRRTTTYRLLPLVRGAWIRPLLVVRDKYFQKVLRILPTEGMKMDKEGLLVWVPAEGDKAETAETAETDKTEKTIEAKDN